MPREMEPVHEWLERAEHDLEAADLLIQQMPHAPELAVFHCQQAAEKYLKAFLTFAERAFRKVHDLDVIVQECSEIDPAFAELLPRVVPLRRFAVEVRYPQVHTTTSEEVHSALSAARTVREFVRKRIAAGAGGPPM